jgi:CRP-like cAMP-binding protein
VQSAARPFQGFALVLQGHAVLLSPDASGQLVEIGELGPGECFGDQLTAGGSNQDLSIVAREDLKLLVFENQAVTRLLNQSPSLAAEIGDAIESRRKAAQAARIQRAATSLPVHAST